MAKKTEIKTEKIEREYIIPLRSEIEKVPAYRRAGKAISAIKKFIVRHMKIRDGDENKVKIDRYLNEEIWHRGIKHPPVKIKVKATKEGENVIVELAVLPDVLKFKKAREEGREKKAEEKKKPVEKEKPQEEGQREKESADAEKKEDEKEKTKSVEEATEKMDKMDAKKMKHTNVPKVKPLKHQFRQALQK
ncbi:MAG: 50S ribosomal protein L31e [archaeon]|nr:50S ribosomal protein L31e [archaeon]